MKKKETHPQERRTTVRALQLKNRRKRTKTHLQDHVGRLLQTLIPLDYQGLVNEDDREDVQDFQ